jgi:hypothetical protein
VAHRSHPLVSFFVGMNDVEPETASVERVPRIGLGLNRLDHDWRSSGLIHFERHFDGCCSASSFLRTSSARFRNSS